MNSGAMHPSNLETEFTTSAGKRVRTRLIRPDDAAHLIDLFLHLSPDTRRRRFNAGLQNVGEKQLHETAQLLASVDNHTSGGAILGFTHGTRHTELVGVARLARLPDQGERTIAEVAVVVRDDYQGQGIGTELLRLLLILARQMDIDGLTATVQADNSAIFGILNKLNIPVKTHTSRGETEMWIDITP